MVCACMPTFNMLHQSRKKPKEPTQPEHWAFGMPTPNFLRKNRLGRRRWPVDLSTSDQTDPKAEAETFFVSFSGSKNTPSSTDPGLSAVQSPRPSNNLLIWGRSTPESKSLMTWKSKSGFSEVASFGLGSMLSIKSPTLSRQSRDRVPSRRAETAPLELELNAATGQVYAADVLPLPEEVPRAKSRE